MGFGIILISKRIFVIDRNNFDMFLVLCHDGYHLILGGQAIR